VRALESAVRMTWHVAIAIAGVGCVALSVSRHVIELPVVGVASPPTSLMSSWTGCTEHAQHFTGPDSHSR